QQGCNGGADDDPQSRAERPEGVVHVAITEEKLAGTGVVYDLQGTLLEACSCGVLCPCWVGEDPDGGMCDAIIAYHFDAGTVQGVAQHGPPAAVGDGVVLRGPQSDPGGLPDHVRGRGKIAREGVRRTRRAPAILVVAIGAAWALSIFAQTTGRAVLLNHGRLI